MENMKQSLIEMNENDNGRKRVQGGRHKKISQEMEQNLIDWICGLKKKLSTTPRHLHFKYVNMLVWRGAVLYCCQKEGNIQ